MEGASLSQLIERTLELVIRSLEMLRLESCKPGRNSGPPVPQT